MAYDILLKIGSVAFMVIFFGLCIFIHELGHFLAAKWRGLHIVAFSIGFRKVWWKKINGVEYRIGCIPVGGYVDLPQIDSSAEEVKDENGKVLPRAKPLDRMIVAFAGPFFNMLFGLLLGIVIWIHGLPQDTPSLTEIKVESVQQESPEWRAGLRKGDVIYEINGERFDTTWNGFVKKILFTIGEVTLTVRRNGETLKITYKPTVNKKINPEEEIAYPFFLPEIPVYLYPHAGSVAEKAGVRPGDRLLKLNGKTVIGIDELQSQLLFSGGEPLELELLRDGEIVRIKNVKPEPIEVDGEKGRWLLGFTNNPIETVQDGMPMQLAGVRKGDRIVAVAGRKVDAIPEIQTLVRQLNGQSAAVEIERDGKRFTVQVAPKFMPYTTLGVDFAAMTHPNPFLQLKRVVLLTWNSLRGIGYSLGNTLHLTQQHTTIRPKHMSGPIGIGKYLFLSVYRGSLILGLSVVVVITFNLGLVNLLPIPILDGGHILLALLEILFRRPVSRKILEPISIGFIVLLIGFMIFVSFYDVKKIVSPAMQSVPAPEPAGSSPPAAEKPPHAEPASQK
ncbi:MAG: site-2 protease family protein [Lentisphaeria bacterium]|nr:site-2 protease family protein [Lentisphaeria bacterium]